MEEWYAVKIGRGTEVGGVVGISSEWKKSLNLPSFCACCGTMPANEVKTVTYGAASRAGNRKAVRWSYNVCKQCAYPNHSYIDWHSWPVSRYVALATLFLIPMTFAIISLALFNSFEVFLFLFMLGIIIEIVVLYIARSEVTKNTMTPNCVSKSELPVGYKIMGYDMGDDVHLFRRKDYAEAFARLNDGQFIPPHSYVYKESQTIKNQ